MPEKRVKVAFVNPPKQDGWSGSIKAEDGEYYNVHADELDRFEKGAEYDINFDFNKKGYKNVKGFSRVSTSPPPQHATGQNIPTRPAPQPSGHYNGSNRDDTTDRHIFITGVVGRAMGSGAFKGEQIIHLSHMAAVAYDEVFRGVDSKVAAQDNRFPEEGSAADVIPEWAQ